MNEFDLKIKKYYENLPNGKKDAFVRGVADAIGKSSQNVRMKIKNGGWGILETREVGYIIEGRRLDA